MHASRVPHHEQPLAGVHELGRLRTRPAFGADAKALRAKL
jgi:hypothetical protein